MAEAGNGDVSSRLNMGEVSFVPDVADRRPGKERESRERRMGRRETETKERSKSLRVFAMSRAVVVADEDGGGSQSRARAGLRMSGRGWLAGCKSRQGKLGASM